MSREDTLSAQKSELAERLKVINRRRWGVRFAIAIGVGASTVTQVLNAPSDPISQAIHGWPPLSLLLVLELLARIPSTRWQYSILRFFGATLVGFSAAWVSYFQMAAMAFDHQEGRTNSFLWPLTVDGLILVGSVALVELGREYRDLEKLTVPVTTVKESTPLIPTEPDLAPIFIPPAPQLNGASPHRRTGRLEDLSILGPPKE